MLKSEPNYSLPNPSLADVTADGTARAFGSLAAGPSGAILVTAHPSNGSAIARVGGLASDGTKDVSASKGQALAAGGSYEFAVSNANKLCYIAESGSPVLCVTAV